MSKLSLIQTRLKAPKNQFNKFGGYKYRSLEDILEAFKPLEEETGCHLIVKDEIVHIGDRYYVKAEAYIYEGDKLLGMGTGFAREEDQKGMSPAQSTGSASSYARKYCLSGLLLCDDTKDPDFYPPEDCRPQKNETKDNKSDERREKEIEERIAILKQSNLAKAQRFQNDTKEKMIAAINDQKFHSINGQEALAKRIKEQLDQLPQGPKDVKFTIPQETKE